MTVAPLFAVWKPLVHAVCALVWAEEPWAFRVPETVAAEAELEELEPPLAEEDDAGASLLAQEERASAAVRAVPMARPTRMCFKEVPFGGGVCSRPAVQEPLGEPGDLHGRERR